MTNMIEGCNPTLAHCIVPWVLLQGLMVSVAVAPLSETQDAADTLRELPIVWGVLKDVIAVRHRPATCTYNRLGS